jgi:hypothetical protein
MRLQGISRECQLGVTAYGLGLPRARGTNGSTMSRAVRRSMPATLPLPRVTCRRLLSATERCQAATRTLSPAASMNVSSSRSSSIRIAWLASASRSARSRRGHSNKSSSPLTRMTKAPPSFAASIANRGRGNVVCPLDPIARSWVVLIGAFLRSRETNRTLSVAFFVDPLGLLGGADLGGAFTKAASGRHYESPPSLTVKASVEEHNPPDV